MDEKKERSEQGTWVRSPENIDESSKQEQLESFTEDPQDQSLTTDQGVKVSHTDDSLKAGARGPTLMEDFHFREKLTHFDHERIPERVVHARGSGAHGFFQVYEPMAEYTSAGFLQDPARKTPVFVRFSTVVGFRGSADTVRDVRGFATKFYTEEGNYDLVGNNIPIFFIQDAIKFPDLVHSIKPEPHNEMPQASAAHDTFWDFVSSTPETTAMIMWLLSDHEKEHIIAAFHFDIGKVERVEIQKRIVEQFTRVDGRLGKAIADGLGLPAPEQPGGTAVTKSSPAVSFLDESGIAGVEIAEPGSAGFVSDKGVVAMAGAPDSSFNEHLIEAIRLHRHWTRDQKKQVPAWLSARATVMRDDCRKKSPLPCRGRAFQIAGAGLEPATSGL